MMGRKSTWKSLGKFLRRMERIEKTKFDAIAILATTDVNSLDIEATFKLPKVEA